MNSNDVLLKADKTNKNMQCILNRFKPMKSTESHYKLFHE